MRGIVRDVVRNLDVIIVAIVQVIVMTKLSAFVVHRVILAIAVVVVIAVFVVT